ncbi:hypothetical protein QQF64_024621 [Cirrhinus molitorella]|uniref:Uncharacterized protein n=1 Tax=Cirrhinus molitorella TaxID=172907 RepID=A0ABR3NLR7_9TELE
MPLRSTARFHQQQPDFGTNGRFNIQYLLIRRSVGKGTSPLPRPCSCATVSAARSHAPRRYSMVLRLRPSHRCAGAKSIASHHAQRASI